MTEGKTIRESHRRELFALAISFSPDGSLEVSENGRSMVENEARLSLAPRPESRAASNAMYAIEGNESPRLRGLAFFGQKSSAPVEQRQDHRRRSVAPESPLQSAAGSWQTQLLAT